jgi:hypothetical protein
VAALQSKVDTALSPVERDLAIQERNQRMLEIQAENGVPSYRRSVVPVQMAKESAIAILDPNTSADDALSMFNNYMGNFKGYEDDAAGQLKENGLKGAPISALFSMGQNTDRIGLVKSIKKSDELSKLVSTDDKNAIASKTSRELEKFSSAISHLPNHVDEISAYDSAIKNLANMYVTQGIKPSEAAKKATEEVLTKNFKVLDGTVLLPANVDEKNIRRFLSKQESLLSKQKILVPDNVPETSKEDYRRIVAKSAIPRTVGDWIMFYDQTGNPILNEDKIIFDEYGNISNAEDASIRFSITNAEAMGFKEFKGFDASYGGAFDKFKAARDKE